VVNVVVYVIPVSLSSLSSSSWLRRWSTVKSGGGENRTNIIFFGDIFSEKIYFINTIKSFLKDYNTENFTS